MAAIVRAARGGGSKPTGEAGKTDKLAQGYPRLVEFLTLDRWDDGSPRERGTILILAEDDWWKAWCNDKDGDRSLWVSDSTLGGLLAAVDEHLGSPEAVWRPNRTKVKGKR